MAKTTTVICKRCHKPFETEVRLTPGGTKDGKKWETTQMKGRTCPKCKKIRDEEYQKARGARIRTDTRFGEGAVSRKLEDIAASMGISYANAKVIERRALAKIRENPELETLFRDWLAEGGQIQEIEPVKIVPDDPSATLVDYMLELSHWFHVHDNLVGREREKEALQCRREIERFHKTFRKQLVEMNLISE